MAFAVTYRLVAHVTSGVLGEDFTKNAPPISMHDDKPIKAKRRFPPIRAKVYLPVLLLQSHPSAQAHPTL